MKLGYAYKIIQLLATPLVDFFSIRQGQKNYKYILPAIRGMLKI